MWSKQTSGVTTADNKNNMTSFRNKINKKRKDKNETMATDLVEDDKSNSKHRGRNRGKKSTVNGNGGAAKNKNSSTVAVASVKVKNDVGVDVVLRNGPEKEREDKKTVKRYSDSFVIENEESKIKEETNGNVPTLTRAVSGFFIIDQARRANRRFSDLFKPSSTSTENIKNATDKENKEQTNKAVQSKTAQKSKTKTQTTKSVAKPKKEQPQVEPSYLKRVKSKIYKSKNEASHDEVDGENLKSRKVKTGRKPSEANNGRIPEESEVAPLTPNGIRKSLTHFDFRLTRQTSNLESIRPKTSSSLKDDKFAESTKEKPMMAKAKSSSAINLSLLRTRRNKILEQVASRLGAKDVHEEFDFIAFGSVNNVAKLTENGTLYGSQIGLQKQPSWLHIHKEKEESKQSQPVSRSGSDRRPDSVREESGSSKHQDSTTNSNSGSSDVHGDGVHEKSETASPENSTILPAVEKSRRGNSNINRSESVKEQSEKRKQRRNISDPSHNTTSQVDLDRHPALSNTDSGSSSNSSISCNGRLSESPSNSVDAVGQTGPARTSLDSDSDLDGEADSWHHLVSLEQLKNLSAHEKKRQDVINELFHTESSHVRNLKVLYKIFYKKIHDSQTLKPDELSLIFPNIKEMLDIHMEINKEMRRCRNNDPLVRDVGDYLVKIFEERHGEALKKAAATFCERQQLALEFIKKRRESNSKFDSVLSECEKTRQCRRLPFQGILPTEMQRLSKYPLLLERLMSSIESIDGERPEHQQEELAKLRRVHHVSKEILNYVNEAAKVAHNRHRLEEIQKHLDTSSFERSELAIAQEFRTIDLTKYRLIIEGGMQLRRPNKGVVPVHILLLEEAVVILHREGDKFLLKFFQSGSLAQPLPLSPIIRMNTLLVRTNAVCKNALFLVNMSTSNSQMYDLIAEDEIKREVWFKHFSDATEAYKRREGKSGIGQTPPDDDSDTESVQELPPAEVTPGRAEAVGGKEDNASATTSTSTIPSISEDQQSQSSVTQTSLAQSEDESAKNFERAEEEEKGSEQEKDSKELSNSPEMVAGGGGLVESSKVSAEEWPLIQPSQVSVAVPPVHTAESMLTPLEQIRRKDALVKQALEDKEGLVADMLSIPREHFQHIADMATVDNSLSREPSERVLASIFQVDQLQKAINRSLNVTEKDVLVAKGGKHLTCNSQEESTSDVATIPLTIPIGFVRDIANSLSSQLTTLLSEVKHMEEERDRLRKELHNVRERLHEEHNLHSALTVDNNSETDCASQVDTSGNDSLQIVSKSDCEDEQ